MPQAVIAIGGNHESTKAAIDSTLDTLRQRTDVQVIRDSSLYRTAAMGPDAGDAFLNAACLIETTLLPLELLNVLQKLETDSGRTRELHWGPRTLDLDIVFYGHETFESERLTLPHPHCWYRRFVIEPAAEICPETVHPENGFSMIELQERLHATTFPVLLLGDFDQGSQSNSLRSEYPDVSFEHVAEAVSLPDAGLGIAVTAQSKPLPAMWLQTSSDSCDVFVRNVLTAARGRCERLS